MKLALDSARLNRHRAFYSGQPMDRPLIGSWLFGFFIHQQFPSVAAAMRPGPVHPDDIPVELFLQDIDALWQAYSALDDDYPFSTGAFYGVPWLEAIMGCPVYFSGTNMYSTPCIEDWQSFAWQRPVLERNAWAQKLLEFLGALVKHSAGRFSCGPTLMRGPADMCSAMLGGTRLALDLYDCPENVARLAELCADVWIDVARAQLDLLPASDNGYMIGCAGLRCWMPDKGVWLQDDAVSLLSPRFYNQYFMAPVRRIARAFSCVAFHLHGNYLWPVDLLLPLDEVAVQELNYDVGVCQLEKLIPAWRKIQERKPCLAFADVTAADLARIRDELAPSRLSLQTLAPTMQEAVAKRNLVYAGGQAC